MLCVATTLTSTLHWFGETTSHAVNRQTPGAIHAQASAKRPLDYGGGGTHHTAPADTQVAGKKSPSTTHAARASFLDPRNRHGLRGVGLGRPRERVLVAGGLLRWLC